MSQGTYVSSDACERSQAFRLGYRQVCHHPKEVGVLEPPETLVIDFDHVLFDEKDLAVRKANEAANLGVLVGIHTYYPEDPRLQRFLALPNVHIAKTHRLVLKRMRQPNANPSIPPSDHGGRSVTTHEEATHVRENLEASDAGHRTGAPVVPGEAGG
jgi:hypothetical protein